MANRVSIFFWGLIISFLGSIPFGVINITATQLSLSQGHQSGLIYAIGVVLIELMYVSILLRFGTYINPFLKKNLPFLYALSILLCLGLAIWNFLPYTHAAEKQSVDLFSLHPFILGLSISLLNPIQLPYWMGWNFFLFKKGKLKNKKPILFSYCLSIGVGSFAVLLVYIYLGNFMLQWFDWNQGANSQAIFGFIYLTIALYLLGLLGIKKLKERKTQKNK